MCINHSSLLKSIESFKKRIYQRVSKHGKMRIEGGKVFIIAIIKVVYQVHNNKIAKKGLVCTILSHLKSLVLSP